MEPWELAAREAIRDTLMRYAHCADTGRFQQLAELFCEDGTLEIEEHERLVGRTAILDFLARTKASLGVTLERPYIRHHISSIRIDVAAADRATASSYFLAITERGPDHWGRYHDDLVRSAERWLLQRRRVSVDGHSPASWRAMRG
jgi:3-phenylpropionate/cinnamic acid dioxygenase small subunit